MGKGAKIKYISELHDYGAKLPESAEPAISDERLKAIKSAIEELIDGEFARVRDYAADHIDNVAASRARKFLERVLRGDEDAAMSLFGDKVDSERFEPNGKPWSKVIHGTIFEAGGVAIRRKIVEAHAELLRNERIKDLESIVEGLRQQVVKLEQELSDTRRRY